MTDPAATRDRFLGGRVLLAQPVEGYRAATDPVFLAAAVPASPGESVLDLGVGAGAASLCLAARIPELQQEGIDIEPAYLALAEENAATARVTMKLHEGDVAAMPAVLRAKNFDHVITNPPYGLQTALASPNPIKDRAHREAGDGLSAWLGAAVSRLRSRGWLTLIHRADRLPEILAALAPGMGDIAVLPLAAREGRAAKRIVVRARKASRGPFRLLAPLVLHQGPAHLADQDDFTPAARAILRDAQPLSFEDRT
ncbi:MAG: methyltransferase [Pseudomonadota bacterium]